MSSGAALSTPREHLDNIGNAIKATGLFAATARIGFDAAAKACPLGSLPTVMGRKSILLLEENEEIQERIQNGLSAEPSALADDHQFDHLGDAMKHVIKLGTMTSKKSSKRDGAMPSLLEVHEAKIRDQVMSMLWSSVQIARQEAITEMQTALSSCLGAAEVRCDRAQSNAVLEHDKMVDSLAKVSGAVAAYRKHGKLTGGVWVHQLQN